MDISGGLNIERYATLNAENTTMAGVGVAMLKNALDAQEQMGAEMTKMMEQSVNPSVGSNLDLRV